MGNLDKKETKVETYKSFVALGMFILHFYIDCVLLVSYFSWVGVIALFLVNIVIIFSMILRDNSKAIENIPLSSRFVVFYLSDIILVTFYRLIDIIKSVQSYISDGLFVGWNKLLILALVGVFVFLLLGSRSVLFFLGICLTCIYGDIYALWPYGSRLLFIYVVATLVLILLMDVADRAMIYEPKADGRNEYKLHKRLWYMIYFVIVVLWAMHARINTDSFDWTTISRIFNVLWSKWIWIAVLLFAVVFISNARGALESAGEQKMPMLNDMYNTMCLFMAYLLVGFMVNSYTILNIPFFLFFIVYTLVVRTRMADLSKTGKSHSLILKVERSDYYKYCENFPSAIALFVGGIIVICMFSKGLYLNAVVTIVLLWGFNKILKAWREKNELSKCNMLLVKRMLEQAQISMSNISFWLKGIVIVLLEVIAYESSRCFTTDNYIEIVNLGMPDYNILLVYAIIVAFTLLTYAILYKRNPMGCRPSVLKCLVVFLTFCVSSVVFMNNSNRTVYAIYDYENGIYKVTVERRYDADYELSVKLGDWELDVEKVTSEKGKYDVYEIPVDIDIDWYDMEHISVAIVNSDGTSSFYSDWNSTVLMYMYAGEM